MNTAWKTPPELVGLAPIESLTGEPIPFTTSQESDLAQQGLALELSRFANSDAGNAERFQAMYGSNVRHVAESGQWLIWDGARWLPDTSGEVVRLFIATMRELGAQAFRHDDSRVREELAKYALKCTNNDKVRSGLEMAKSLLGMTISVTELDSDPWLVGTPDGVIDLRTGSPVAPDRRNLITKSIGASYVAGAECPRWMDFIDTVTAGDRELAEYLQAAVGYTLTGLCREQCLFFLHGTGCNGKGVFSETIKRLVGDYAQTAPESLFTRDRNSSATNDVARLSGCRLAIAAELDEGSAFAESRIKALTGSDTISARFLHKEYFDFVPTHKFWISGNHKPTVRGTDQGIWRRLRLVPFDVRITDEKKDPALVEKLAEEMPGILNWALSGCTLWQRHGLKTPGCVRQATEDYRREEDVIGQFLSDCTVEIPGARTPTSSVFQSYGQWCAREGILPRYQLNARRLIRRIGEHGGVRGKSNGTPVWVGLALVHSGELGEDME
jgi:putative DNA primase/helicase